MFVHSSYYLYIATLNGPGLVTLNGQLTIVGQLQAGLGVRLGEWAL